jgi:Transposase DDE domain
VFDTTLPSGKRMRYQVLRIAVPRKGRALPLLQLAYDRDRLPADKSQNQLEQEALLAVLGALPSGVVRPVVLADRGFRRAGFIYWLQRHGVDYVVRLSKGSCLTEADGKQWKLGEEGLERGQLRWVRGVRYGLYHGRSRDLWVNVALCWRIPKSRARDPRRRKQPEEPWYLATSLKDAQSAASWYWQRGWIEQSFKDSKGRFGLAEVMVGCPKRLGRLLMALTVALAWLTLMGLPEVGAMPRRWQTAVAQRGRASVISLALALLDKLGTIPFSCLPRSSPVG